MSEKAITASWTEWQGMVVDGTFYLDRYLGGTDRSAVYLTDWGEPKGKPAAIKLIAADSESAELHLSRWKLASGLSHSHLLRVYQSGLCELDGLKLLYVVMEYAEEDLSEILLQRPLTVEEARETFAGVLEALAALHHQGLVHGQLKPANIMAIGDQLKISSDSIGSEGTGPLYPSIYGAPEAASDPLSPSADIWSFGMTMVEALTQQLPCGKSGADGELELPALPAPFLEIAQHCLASDSQRRWTIAGIRAHLSPKQAQTSRQLQTEQAEGTAQIAKTAPGSNLALLLAKSEAPQRPPFLLEDETNARSLVEICKPYVPFALAAGLLLAIAGTVLTAGAAKSQQGRDTASISSAHVSPAAASAGAASPAGSVGAGEHVVQASEANSNSGAAGTSSPAVRNLQAAQQAPQVDPRPESMSAPLANTLAPATLVPGTAIERPLPSVPLRARRTIHGRVKIKVKVAVDPSGSVARATLGSPASSNYFAGIAMETARRWRFSPAQMNGQNVASEWILKFEFGRAGTKISPFAVVAADQRL